MGHAGLIEKFYIQELLFEPDSIADAVILESGRVEVMKLHGRSRRSADLMPEIAKLGTIGRSFHR